MKTPITKPLLGTALHDWSALDFANREYLATPKIDGIRVLKINGRAVSRSFKLIRNTYIREILEKILPEGADGEITGEDRENFQNTASSVMAEDGKPIFKYYLFDWVQEDLSEPYAKRILAMQTAAKQWMTNPLFKTHVELLIPIPIKSAEELQEFEDDCLSQGYEGVILRTAAGPYKCGRASLREQYILKIKRFTDGEAMILDFGEKMHNTNEAEKDNFGRTKRSSAKAGKVPADTLGYLLVQDLVSKETFEVGTGFDDKMRKHIWNNRSKYMGKTIVYKHFAESGVLDKPRFPVFKGFRDKDDMGE